MAISTIAASRRFRRWRDERGFTLIEISLVILIVGVVLTLVVPRLRDPGRAELNSQAHRLQLVFKLLRSEAVLGGVAYRLNFDLDQQRYWVSPHDMGSDIDLDKFAVDIGSLARGTTLDGQVRLTDVSLPAQVGKVAQGQVFTVFYPDGTVEPTVIHLATEREAVTLWVSLSSSRLKNQQGYHDVAYGS